MTNRLLPALMLPFLGCLSSQSTVVVDRSDRMTATFVKEASPKASPTEDLGGSIDRDMIVALAIARSGSLSQFAHRARAMIHAARGEGALPAGELGFQAWNLPLARPYAAGDADMYMVELKQRLPALGALDARTRAGAEEAQVLLAELAMEERLTAQRAADAYADYVRGRQDHVLHNRHLALLEQMQGAVLARLTTSKGDLGEASRVELEMARTRRAIARVTGDVERARATINTLLRRAPDSPLGNPREVEPETVRLPGEELLARASARRGATLAADARIRAARARREAAEIEAQVPEFSFGLAYWQDPAQRPGVGVNAAMSLPWFWGPQKHRIREAQEAEASEIASGENASIALQTEVAVAVSHLASTERELITVREQAVPAARRSLDSVRASFTTGNASLLEWIDVDRSVLDLEMEANDLVRELAHAVAALEVAVGSQLPRVAITSEMKP